MQGWIKLHRKLMDWQWYHSSEMVHLFIHLILKANHKDNKWQGNIVKRGQMITGRKQLNTETGLSEQTIRTCLNKLKSTNELTIKTTNRFSLITIVNFNAYNSCELENNSQPNQLPNQQLTSNQPATNQQLTTNKNDNNANNEKNVKKTTSEVYLPTDNELLVFDVSRKKFPGTKKGAETEFVNLCKKHSDWKDILPLLLPAIEKQIVWRENANGEFRPHWKNFQTWINQRCWEDEVPEVPPASGGQPFDAASAAQRKAMLEKK